MNKIRSGLWVGDIWDAREGDTSRFDRVITICQDSVESNVGCEYEHYPLSDGEPPSDAYNPGEFSSELFEQAVSDIISSLEEGKTVFVHCHAGQSRSIMACTAAIATIDSCSFDKAYEEVKQSRSTNPSQDLIELSKSYVN